MAHQVKLLGPARPAVGRMHGAAAGQDRGAGPAFNEDAKQGYVALAGSTWDAGDWDFLHYDRKAEQAMLGDEVWPDRVASRRMPTPAREAMLVERARLVDALEASARRQSPREAAKAQVAFDCWLGEVGASGRPDLSTGCKETYMAELAKAEDQAARRARHAYAVSSTLGSALLSVRARNTITDAVRASRLLDAQRIEVVGFGRCVRLGARQRGAGERARARGGRGLLQAGVPAEMIDSRAAGTDAGGGAAPWIAGSTSPSSDRRAAIRPGGCRRGRGAGQGGRERLKTHRQPLARGDHAQVPFRPAGSGGGADRRGAGRAVPGPHRHLQAADRQAGRERHRPQPDDRRARCASRSCRSSASRRSR